jgi:hypothetical protein
MHFWALVLILGVSGGLLYGCASDTRQIVPEVSERSLLTAFAKIQVVEASDDPLVDHRPQTVDCNDLVGWYAEDEGIEVDTGDCNYLALSAPAVLEAPKGSLVATEISHFDLNAAQPTEAHIAILVAGTVAWQQTLPIPGQAKVHRVDFVLPTDIREGDDVGLHLHNHGQNTYLFHALYVSPPVDDGD